RQGDLFIRKAAASTIEELVVALKELFDVPNHPVKVIGWRHGEKLYETLASAQELTTAEDRGDYFRIPMDSRDLDYSVYMTQGDVRSGSIEDFHSHNATRLDVAGIKALLLQLPEVREELRKWQERRA